MLLLLLLLSTSGVVSRLDQVGGRSYVLEPVAGVEYHVQVFDEVVESERVVGVQSAIGRKDVREVGHDNAAHA